MKNYIQSDIFTIYPTTSSYRKMYVTNNIIDDNVNGFKKSFWTVPFNGNITDIGLDNIGENVNTQYDIRMTVQSGATTTQTSYIVSNSSSLTTPSGFSNFSTVSYYNTLPPYNSNLVHYYPFSYNYINVADTADYKSLIGSGSFTNEKLRAGIASHKMSALNGLVTVDRIAQNGTGSTNTNTTVNATGYTLICFWLYVEHNFNANTIYSVVFTFQSISTGTDFQNKNMVFSLKNNSNTDASNEDTFTYQVETRQAYNWTGSNTTAETLTSGIYTVNNKSWNHFAIYITPQRYMVWINGVTAIYSPQRNYAYDNTYFTLGNYPFTNQGGNSGIHGYMNDLRIYNNNTTDFLGDTSSFSTLGTTYPKINNYFNVSNITTSTNTGYSIWNSITPISVLKNDRVYFEIRENSANTSNFDEIVNVKLLMSST
jgi:hypothetical protein